MGSRYTANDCCVRLHTFALRARAAFAEMLTMEIRSDGAMALLADGGELVPAEYRLGRHTWLSPPWNKVLSSLWEGGGGAVGSHSLCYSFGCFLLRQ